MVLPECAQGVVNRSSRILREKPKMVIGDKRYREGLVELFFNVIK